MKNRTAHHAILMLILPMLCISLFFGCRKTEDGPASIIGTWKITECIVNGEALTDMNDCFFYFYEDNTGKKVILDELQFNFSYSFDGSSCILFNITYDDGEVEAGTYAEMTVKGDTMSVYALEDGVEEIVTLTRITDQAE